jgi:ABC-2 type transport system permease protein
VEIAVLFHPDNGIMSTVPTQFLTSALMLSGLLQAVCVVAIFTMLALWFWHFGLKRYKSESS